MNDLTKGTWRPVACSCLGEQKVLVAGAVGCGLAAALQQSVKGSSVGASMIHVGEMIAENLALSPQIGGNGEEGGGTWCGRLQQRLRRLKKQEQAEDKDTADILPIKKCYFGTISPRWGGLAEMCKSMQRLLETL